MAFGPGYDSGQAIEASFNENLEAINVINLGGNLVPQIYDDIQLSYIASGNGTGQIGTVIYSLDSLVIATLMLTYDSSNRLIEVKRI